MPKAYEFSFLGLDSLAQSISIICLSAWPGAGDWLLTRVVEIMGELKRKRLKICLEFKNLSYVESL